MRRFVLGLLVTAVIGGGCTEDVETPTYEYGLFPKVAHSGFNAKTTFKVMFATSAPAPEWSVDDPSVATIAPTEAPILKNVDTADLRFALATMLKAGTANVIMTYGGRSISSALQVKEYTDDQITLGKARYETAATDPARQPCASCHQKPEGVDHSPLKMAGFDDPIILGVIQNATYPEKASGGSTTSPYAPKGPLAFTGHKWGLTDPEKDGILAHLRSLPLGKVVPQ